ncbi:bifunctional acetate--CoA ligase family protein/GNAT family N-acetyltransferase [Chitinimonas sp. BJB300]|uniref:bifunctional acetate--CoA ligase family protein/GNAT family N-acetyltransferase n=1 Tax=Chitinimonas sp. BJB300 TaxID=1559339 RepID=UPI0018ED810A|nr:bifunctional acetate--CoA ligase family protein/GNAT family N-acetyltransferase [Chitinimonas sp. BJB300]
MERWTAMKAHYLTPLFQPRSVVVIGASETPDSVGALVFRNLLDARFKGRFHGVNLRHAKVFGQTVYARLAAVPAGEIDLAIIATPARTLPGLMRECGERGVKMVLVLSRDFVAVDVHNRTLLEQAVTVAKQYGVRMLGPNLLGMMRPATGLIAANYHGKVKPGNLALVAQSSSVASAILDWAEAHDVGFSTVVSLGAAADVNFGEVLDYLSQDNATRGILLYLEDVGEARGFMSALRAAARQKPVVCLKVGREPIGGDRVTRTHSERLIGRDDAFDAALRRTGVLRVPTMVHMTIAAQMLAANIRTKGRRLAVISNGYGVGRMAVDRAQALGVELPKLSPPTIAKLDAALPAVGAHDNPVDILGDAPPARFLAAAEACLADPNIDGVLVILTPQAGTDDLATAERMIELRGRTDKLLMLVWLGDKRIALSRKLLDRAHMAYFLAPEHAVEAFASLAAWSYVQELSLQTPGPLTNRSEPDVDRARAVIAKALAAGRSVLTTAEALAVLDAFHIPYPPTLLVRTPEEAVAAAARIGLPVALKIDADNLLHKSDIDGVLLNLNSLEQVADNTESMLAYARQRLPKDSVHGMVVQKMHGKRHGRELMLGVTRDAVFGPMIAFGSGGLTVDVFEDIAVTLPPLNDMIAANLIRRTKVARALGTFHSHPAVDMEAVKDILLRVSEMACELPEMLQLDLNPVVVDEYGAVTVDASIVVAPLPAGFHRYSHMAVHPYPVHLVAHGYLKDSTACVFRPIRPEDADELQRFVREELSDESRFNRFMSTLKQLPPSMLVRFTQLDYAREMAVVATVEIGDKVQMVGVTRYTANPDAASAEFAISIADRWQGKGLGAQLMMALFNAARDAGLCTIEGDILASNSPMLGMMKKLGFDIRPHPDDATLRWVVKSL